MKFSKVKALGMMIGGHVNQSLAGLNAVITSQYTGKRKNMRIIKSKTYFITMIKYFINLTPPYNSKYSHNLIVFIRIFVRIVTKIRSNILSAEAYPTSHPKDTPTL